MKQKILFGLFLLLLVAQFAVPSYMAFKAEGVLHNGTVLKFKCRPYDPRDLFRGHYLNVRVETPVYTFADPAMLDGVWIERANAYTAYSKTYVAFVADEDGYAKIQKVGPSAKDDSSVLMLECNYQYAKDDKPSTLTPFLPFSRFYLNEDNAKAFEAALQASLRKLPASEEQDNNTYLLVSIGHESYTVVDLVIAGQSVNAMLRRGDKPLSYAR